MSFIDPRTKLFGHMGKLAALQDGNRPFPISLEVDLANRCNLGCEWCHFGWTHTKGPLVGKQEKPADAIAGGDLMSPELAFGLVDELAGIGGISVTWTGGGEPTIWRHFDELVERAYTGGVAQGIYTNGTLIRPERASLMKKAMTFVYVSLDAADKDSYIRMKATNGFQAACNGISRLADADGKATIGLGFLVGPESLDQLWAVPQLGRDLGADYVQFRPIIQYSHDQPGIPSEDTGWVNQALNELVLIQEAFDNVEVDLDRFRGYRDWDGHGYQTCWWSGLQAVVTPNGKVWSCVNKREHPAALIGDLSSESFREVWARRPLVRVDGSCRVACRGHVANQTLAEIMRPHPHPEFV